MKLTQLTVLSLALIGCGSKTNTDQQTAVEQSADAGVATPVEAEIIIGHLGPTATLAQNSSLGYSFDKGMASSFLKPEGPQPKDTSDSTDELGYATMLAQWGSKYAPSKVQDKDSTTVWAEGVDGPGMDEVIVAGPANLSRPVSIWAGHGKSKSLFLANNRPKDIEVTIVSSNKTDYGDATEESFVSHRGLAIVANGTYTLNDFYGFQELPIPSFTIAENTRYFVAIRIRSVYAGSKYDDTCIAEIRHE